MNIRIATILIFFIPVLVQGQSKSAKIIPGWHRMLMGGVNMNQISFKNWQGGGENSFSWTFKVDGKMDFVDSSFSWTNALKFQFGETRNDGKKFRKSVDQIRYESVYSRKTKILLNPYLSLNLETQTAPGYKYSEEGDAMVSKFADPLFLTEGFGFGMMPLKAINLRLGVAVKETFTGDFPAPYADNPNTNKIEKIKIEPGSQFALDIAVKFSKSSYYTGKVQSFSNMKTLREIDFRMDNTLISGINKYLNFVFEYDILYDSDQSKRVQIRESFSVGINYLFFSDDKKKEKNAK